jgi:hypothetical protein
LIIICIHLSFATFTSSSSLFAATRTFNSVAKPLHHFLNHIDLVFSPFEVTLKTSNILVDLRLKVIHQILNAIDQFSN